MNAPTSSSGLPVMPGGPQSREQVVQQYFLEHRAKLLDIAAYLDRIDRATATTAETDFRDHAFSSGCPAADRWSATASSQNP